MIFPLELKILRRKKSREPRTTNKLKIVFSSDQISSSKQTKIKSRDETEEGRKYRRKQVCTSFPRTNNNSSILYIVRIRQRNKKSEKKMRKQTFFYLKGNQRTFVKRGQCRWLAWNCRHSLCSIIIFGILLSSSSSFP